MNPPESSLTNNSQNSSVMVNTQNAGQLNSNVSVVNTAPASSNSVSQFQVNQNNQVLTKQRLQDLVREVDSNVQLDDDVEELLLNLAEDFIDDVLDTSCKLSSYRKSSTLEVRDVQLSLEKNWNMWIPGFGCEELKPYKKSVITEAHKTRLNLLKKHSKRN